MSLQAPIVYCQPEETARVARAAFPKGNTYLRVYDALGPPYHTTRSSRTCSRRTDNPLWRPPGWRW